MPYPVIKFGTDGWRGLIADDFTFANVRIAAEAIAAYVHAKEDPAKGLAIGYDTRFGSKGLPAPVPRWWPPTGIPCCWPTHHAHTGTQLCVRERGLAGGIMITSSHNPAQWNGVKYKAWYGGSGKPSIIAEIESYLGKPVARAPPAAAIRGSRFPAPYLKAIMRISPSLDADCQSRA
jgi:phosphomannomutase